MCQRSLKDGVFERLWRGAVQDIVDNAAPNASNPNNNNPRQRAKTRNQKRFRRWKKRSLMKKQKNLMSRQQKKNLNQIHCGGHCLGWMELNRCLANVDPNKASSSNFCCFSTPFHINQCLQLLLSKTGQSKSLKSVVR